MALSSILSRTGIPALNTGREAILSNIIANGGISFQSSDRQDALFHDYLSTLQIKDFYIHRISIFESPLSAELDFCPGPAHKSLFSRTSKPMFQINIRCGPRLARTDMTFYVEKLTHMRKSVETAFVAELKNVLKSDECLSHSWFSSE